MYAASAFLVVQSLPEVLTWHPLDWAVPMASGSARSPSLLWTSSFHLTLICYGPINQIIKLFDSHIQRNTYVLHTEFMT